MASQTLPINQINALPVATVAGVVNGLATLTFGRLTKYFSPTDLGLSGAGWSSIVVGAGAYYYMATPWLDLRGCTVFSVVLARTIGATATAIPAAVAAYVQVRLSASDVPGPVLVNGSSVDEGLSGKVQLATTGTTFGAGTAGDVQRALFTWGGVQQNGYGSQFAGGTDQRIIFTTSTTNPLHPADAWSAAMWASE